MDSPAGGVTKVVDEIQGCGCSKRRRGVGWQSAGGPARKDLRKHKGSGEGEAERRWLDGGARRPSEMDCCMNGGGGRSEDGLLRKDTRFLTSKRLASAVAFLLNTIFRQAPLRCAIQGDRTNYLGSFSGPAQEWQAGGP